MGACIAMAAIATTALGQEQIETDPTRPPVEIAVEAPAGPVAASRLQSVMISPTRRSAIINGVVVELGGKYGDAVLTRVAEDEVVLGSGASRRVLKLYPAVQKVEVAQIEPVAPAAAKSDPPEAKAKAKAKAKPKPARKARARPKATAQPTAMPAADSDASARQGKQP
jgi:hypothetical protein